MSSGRLFAALATIVLTAVACGSTSAPAASKGTITIAGFAFSEGTVLADLYGEALAHDGFTVNYKLQLGNREVVSTAIKSGQVDLYIGYAATDLEFYNKGAGEASGDAAANVQKLNSHLSSLGLVALTPSTAIDQNAFAVTKDTASKYNLVKLSDLAAVGGQLVLGGPPECPTRPFCQPGLSRVYGITFKSFKALDAGDPLTFAALANGSIQVGLVFSSDARIAPAKLVVLQDDKQLEQADDVVPILRSAVASDEAKTVLNEVSAKLTTADLVQMNSQVENLHQDADAVTMAWLQSHNFGM
ncbi:MAG TPA: ABC transporter substrate-binding protein [Candidatus Dormibacteraeota bacterium]|nr:ABC transporter substrate-binding protein [Candidatus Dormibacteraeota bacterium]